MSIQLDETYIIEPKRTRICEIRLLLDGEQIFFRTEGNVSLVDFFGSGGKGFDYVFHIQTAEGVVALPVESNTAYLTDDSITLTVPSEGRPILKNIEQGTRFILALTRPKGDE